MKRMLIKYIGFISIIGIVISSIYYLINRTNNLEVMSFSLSLLMVSIYFDSDKNSDNSNKIKNMFCIIAFILNVIIGIFQLIGL